MFRNVIVLAYWYYNREKIGFHGQSGTRTRKRVVPSPSKPSSSARNTQLCPMHDVKKPFFLLRTEKWYKEMKDRRALLDVVLSSMQYMTNEGYESVIPYN